MDEWYVLRVVAWGTLAYLVVGAVSVVCKVISIVNDLEYDDEL